MIECVQTEELHGFGLVELVFGFGYRRQVGCDAERSAQNTKGQPVVTKFEILTSKSACFDAWNDKLPRGCPLASYKLDLRQNIFSQIRTRARRRLHGTRTGLQVTTYCNKVKAIVPQLFPVHPCVVVTDRAYY